MIETRALTKTFDGQPILTGLNLHIADEESLVVIGPSGSGKSVLMKCLLGLEQPDSGTIHLNGAPADTARPAFLQNLGMLFQTAALFDSLPVWQNVGFALLRHRRRTEVRARALDKLARVNLGPEVADLYPAELSGGMRKRVGLARAIATDPKVMFFDEPTTGLDPVTGQTINRLIAGIVADSGATALTITHDLSTVDTVAHRVAFLHQGRIAWTGTPTEMRDTRHPALTHFLKP